MIAFFPVIVCDFLDNPADGKSNPAIGSKQHATDSNGTGKKKEEMLKYNNAKIRENQTYNESGKGHLICTFQPTAFWPENLQGHLLVTAMTSGHKNNLLHITVDY